MKFAAIVIAAETAPKQNGDKKEWSWGGPWGWGWLGSSVEMGWWLGLVKILAGDRLHEGGFVRKVWSPLR
ncbi:hypothetical protein PR003_g29133 [Phytophthora rubi]|uniref:Uncharacterized protein n=1 Tax=Phytophthora rubi TaxID=129364 RepID=A0A6A3HBS7_9STRA|nr:hypothetical protein PF003_g12241 [Phytophthora fragariae]KAE8967289.1 hypothetical protein PR002_g28110 [Phytophthora rubi]KAE9276177.1 hypothetical protein PR003_g29133 [Phytophthora rubi]